MKKKKVKINGHSTNLHHVEGLSNKEVSPQLQKKFIDRKGLPAARDFLKERGVKISFTTGVYDVIHNGHARYLQLARSLGDALVVGLNSDESVKELKGPNRPILSENERAEMLSFLSFVDFITPFSEETGEEVIKILKPDAYLCVEGSWEGDITTKKEVVAIAECGGDVYYTPRQNPTISTTDIIKRIEKMHNQKLLEEFGDFMKGETK